MHLLCLVFEHTALLMLEGTFSAWYRMVLSVAILVLYIVWWLLMRFHYLQHNLDVWYRTVFRDGLSMLEHTFDAWYCKVLERCSTICFRCLEPYGNLQLKRTITFTSLLLYYVLFVASSYLLELPDLLSALFDVLLALGHALLQVFFQIFLALVHALL